MKICPAALCLAATVFAQASDNGAATALAGRTETAIQLDGRLNEPAWRSATRLELLQQAPRPKEPTPYNTFVRVLVTGDSLYFGFECMDPEPSRIASHTMQRDEDEEGDDSVSIVLDTYGDRRTGYFFRVNAAGARIDGLVSGPEEPSLNWDGIWNARTSRTANGWSVEIEIPSRTLNFARGLGAWGLNLERYIARNTTVMRWTSHTLDSFLYDLSRAGSLTGVDRLAQGVGLEISPYMVGRSRNFFGLDGRGYQAAPGMDVTYRITPQLAAVFTLNTDFAETEVDSRQLNVTRFPLFFPERRQFFLEGSNQFEFGLGLDSFFIPFFSRRMGLFAGQQVPINAGVKLNGRVGRWNIGLLDVQTRDTPLRGANLTLRGTNLFAGRLSRDVNRNLRLGAILTHGNPNGVSSNTLAGFDGVWRTSRLFGDKNFLVGGWTAFTRGGTPAGNRSGWGFKIDYPNDLWDCFTSVNRFGEALTPALGFLPRPGTRRFDASCEFKPRPSKGGPLGFIRQAFMEHRYYRVTNYRGQVESQRFMWAPINVQFESGDRFEFNWVPWYEFLPEPFEIEDGVTLPVGGYRYDRFRLEFETSPHRWWTFDTTTWFGTFYTGRLLQQENDLRFTSPSGRWQTGAGWELNFGRLPEGNFVQRLFQANFAYAFSPDLVLTTFLQYDSESQNVGNNLRLRWTLKPGNDVFFVWNRGWRRLYLSPHDRGIVAESELLALKVRWTFRR